MTDQREASLVNKVSAWIVSEKIASEKIATEKIASEKIASEKERGVCEASTDPIVSSIHDRREAIMANTGATFIIEDDPDVKPRPKPWYEVASLEEVTSNTSTIESLANRYRLDPDFVKAIIWIESTHGWYDRFDPWNKTIRPMNVHTTLWGQLGIERKDLLDPALNVAAGVHILAAIWKRTSDPSIEKVATLYNQLGATKVNAYGKTVAFYASHKPWIHKISSPGEANSFPPPCQVCHTGRPGFAPRSFGPALMNFRKTSL